MIDIYFVIPGDINNRTGGYGYDRELMRGLADLGYRLIHIPLVSSFPFPDAYDLADAEHQFAAMPDKAVVIVDGLAWGVLDNIAKKESSRLRIIALCHHPLMLETGLAVAQAEHFFQSEKKALLFSAAIVVTSATTAKILQETFSIPAEKISQALPGTRSQGFSDCSGNPPVLLTVASLTRRKAHNVLIDALALIEDLEWTARFAGATHFDPEWVAQLIQKIADYGLQDRIHWLGSCDDIAREYLQADIFVLPSLFEGYGMAFAEAMAFGLPIVAARAGAVPDLVPDTAGLLVPPADSDALASALRSLLENPAQCRQLQKGAREAAHHLPNWTDTAAIFDQIIRQLMMNSGH